MGKLTDASLQLFVANMPEASQLYSSIALYNILMDSGNVRLFVSLIVKTTTVINLRNNVGLFIPLKETNRNPPERQAQLEYDRDQHSLIPPTECVDFFFSFVFLYCLTRQVFRPTVHGWVLKFALYLGMECQH